MNQDEITKSILESCTEILTAKSNITTEEEIMKTKAVAYLVAPSSAPKEFVDSIVMSGLLTEETPNV